MKKARNVESWELPGSQGCRGWLAVSGKKEDKDVVGWMALHGMWYATQFQLGLPSDGTYN